MSDFLLELSKNPTTRKLIKTVGLPVPMPPVLRRAKGPMEDRPLHDHQVIYGATSGGAMASACALTLARAGADPWIVGEDALRLPFVEPGEAFGRPPRMLELTEIPDRLRANALLFDATGFEDPDALHSLYEFFHPLISRLDAGARVVVMGRPAEAAATPRAAAAHSPACGSRSPRHWAYARASARVGLRLGALSTFKARSRALMRRLSESTAACRTRFMSSRTLPGQR